MGRTDTDRATAKLTDFGLAEFEDSDLLVLGPHYWYRDVENSYAGVTERQETLTVPNDTTGEPEVRTRTVKVDVDPKEAVTGYQETRVNEQSEIYAFGMLLLKVVTGRD